MNRDFRQILAVGMRDHWPQPLAGLVATGQAAVECVPSLHDAAATLALGPTAWQALLLDIQVLGFKELAMLPVLRRHVSVPVWLLPVGQRSAKFRHALDHGAFSWEEAARVVDQWLQKGNTPLGAPSNRENPPESPRDHLSPHDGPHRRHDAADNLPPYQPLHSPEIPMAADIAARYDGLTGQPLLSEQEIRALLGTAE